MPGSASRRSLGRTPTVTLRAAAIVSLTVQARAVAEQHLVALPRALEQIHRRRADEARDARVHRLAEDLARRTDLRDAPVHEHRDAIGERHRLFLVVRHVDGGDAERALQLLEFEARLEPQLGVEVGQRLVEQEQPRLAHDRARQRHALLLAA